MCEMFKDCGCESLLMFFLLLVVLFDNMGWCENDKGMLLFFFLLLILIAQ